MADNDREPDTGKPDDILEEAKEAFKLCEEREADNRREALEDLKFALLDEQWPEGVAEQRAKDGRPCLTTNLLRPIAKQVKNEARQNRPQIKVHPADSKADVHTATLINGLIRNIEATSKADQAYDIAVSSAVDGGWGYFRANTYYADDDAFDLDICIEAVPNPFSIWGDPYSSKADSSDWNVAFVGELLPKAVFERKYKGAEKVDWTGSEYVSLKSPWIDDDQVFTCEYWTREEIKRVIVLLSDGTVMAADVYAQQKDFLDSLGLTVINERTAPSHKVKQRLLTGAEVLEDREWVGRYIPIVPVYGDEANIEGKRHFRSLIRSAKSAQQKYNVWDSAATEMAAQAPKNGWVGPKGSFTTDQLKWNTSSTTPWAYMEYDVVVPGLKPERPQQDFAAAAAALQQAAAAANDIKAVTGVHEPGLGVPLDAEASGRALIQMQRRSDTSTFNITDNLSRGIEHLGRILLDLIPHVYSGERMVRVMGANGERLPPVQLGRPTQIVDAKGKPEMDEQGQAILGVYDIAAGKYDLDVQAGPSFATQRQEAANQIIELVRAMPAAAPVLGDILANMMDWPEADEIAKRLKSLLPPEARGDDPRLQQLQEALEQVKQQGAQAIQQLQDQLRSVSAMAEDTQIKLDAEKARTQIEEYKAKIAALDGETKRLAVLKDIAMLPGGFQLVAGAIQNSVNSPDLLTGTSPTPPQVGPEPFLSPMMPPGVDRAA